MIVRPIASGSSGNTYVVEGQKGSLLVECGLPPSRLKEKLWENDISQADIDYVLVSHEHNDHAHAMEYLESRGLEIIAPMKFSNTNDKKSVISKDWIIKSYPLNHGEDVEIWGYMIYDQHKEERLFYATDSNVIMHIPQTSCEYLMLECNYQQKYLEESVREGRMERENMRRIMRTHMGLNGLLDFLARCDLSSTKEIWLLHLSDRNANPEEVKKAVQRETGKVVFIA